MFSSKVERYEEVFLLLTYPAWSSVKSWFPGEKNTTEDGRKVKNQAAVSLGMKRGQKDSVRWRGGHYCAGGHLPKAPSRISPAENTLSTSFVSIFVK